MGSFVFKWDHPAEEVYVTGTFDNWTKSEKLEKTGDSFSKDVTLKSADEKIYYKFVVDGVWVTDHTAPQENDASGNLNNVLTTDRIVKPSPETVGIMSGSVAPDSTTAHLAGEVPLEKKPSSDLPGSFPETPGLETGEFGVNPLPAADGAVNPIKLAPGEKVPEPDTFTTNTLTSGVHDDPELVAADKAKSESQEPTFGVSPLPAFAGGVNPVKTAPGEALPEPSSLTTNTIESGVRTDKESYENSGGLGTAPVLPDVVTPQDERDAKGTGILDLPPVSKNLIPESSLPIIDAGGSSEASPFIQSSAAGSTTAQLAGAVPLESSKVPDVVKESQEAAGVDAEASAIPEEVQEKSAVEKELLKEVPVAPTTSEGTAGKDTPDKTEDSVTAGAAIAAVTSAAAVVGGTAYAYAQDAASKLPESVTSKLPAVVQNSINDINAQSTASTNGPTEIAKDTPLIVKESLAEAGQAPEAAANEEAVLEKKAVEAELLKEVAPETATGEPAPKIADAAASVPTEPAKDTPSIVKESLAEAGQAPEAAGNEEAVLEKKAVEQELLKEVKPDNSTGEPAPKSSEGKLAAPETSARPDSRDVSPGTVPGTHTQTAPEVTTGVAASSTDPVTPAKPSTAAAPATPSSSKATDSPATAEKKKKNRASGFFGKIKSKLSSDKKKDSA